MADEAGQGGTADATLSARVRHLLAIAHDHFVERGFEAVSIDGIARAGGVSKETIYHHFADKEALFRAALDAAGENFTARALAVHDRAPSVGWELAELARAILDAAIDEGLFRALWIAVSVSQRMPDLAAQMYQAQWRRLEPVREALEHYARERGASGTVTLELALDFGSLAVEGPALLMGFSHPDGAARDAVARRVALVFAQGIAGSLSGSVEPQGLTKLAQDSPVMNERPAHIRTLLRVAARHFMSHGFESANLDEIGTEARVGRGTVYRHVRSKAGLFAAALRAAAQDCAASAECPTLEDGVVDCTMLTAFVEAALANLASVESIQIHRTAISQSRRDPVLACEIYETLRMPWSDPLARWLASLGLQDDPAWHARQLLTLALRGNRLFAQNHEPSLDERARYARRATAIFLGGFMSTLDPPL